MPGRMLSHRSIALDTHRIGFWNNMACYWLPLVCVFNVHIWLHASILLNIQHKHKHTSQKREARVLRVTFVWHNAPPQHNTSAATLAEITLTRALARVSCDAEAERAACNICVLCCTCYRAARHRHAFSGKGKLQ